MGKAISIKTVSYVSGQQGLRPVSELTEPEQIQLAGELSLAFFNEFYKGKLIFSDFWRLSLRLPLLPT